MAGKNKTLLIVARGDNRALQQIRGLAQKAGFTVETFFRSTTGLGMGRARYQQQCGDDIDFPAIAAHYALAKFQAGRRKFLHGESHFYNRLRRIAAQLDAILATNPPDAIIVYNGFNPQARLALAKAANYNIPVLYAEGAIIPGGGFILDARAPFFTSRGASQLERGWPTSPLNDAQEQAIAALLQAWRKAAVSKYAAQPVRGQDEKRNTLLADKKRPLVLFALQVEGDMNVALGLPDGINHYHDWVDAVLQHIPPDWRVLVKPHPRSAYVPKLSSPNMVLLQGGNLHQWLAQADCVICLSSNVGLEAMMSGTPLIAPPHIYYSGKNLSLPLNRPEALPDLLARALDFRPSQSQRHHFLHYVLLDYHFSSAGNGANYAKLRARIAQARPPLAFDWLPAHYQQWPELVQSYRHARQQKQSHRQALATAQTAFPHFPTYLMKHSNPYASMHAYWQHRLGVLWRKIT